MARLQKRPDLSIKHIMNLEDILRRLRPPKPWSEGDNIPWNEPGFSERMLKAHLSQAHNAASRRTEIIDQHVSWIHNSLLAGQPSAILDLGCGPGLYAQRLASLGHRCVGIDYSPASIAYARQEATAQKLNCTFQEADLRQADFGHGFDLAMLIFGELNVFPKAVAADLLAKAHQALNPASTLLLEVHTAAKIEAIGLEAAHWSANDSGLFSAAPHLLLKESFWDPQTLIATRRYFVINAANSNVERYASSFQGYEAAGYDALLANAGFSDITSVPPFGRAPQNDEYFMLTGRA